MWSFPVLQKGPLGWDLEKSVQYIILGFKGISCGVGFAAVLVLILTLIDLSSNEISSPIRQVVLPIDICALSVAYFFFCNILAKGVADRNRSYIFPWFLVTGIVGVILLVMFFASFTNGFQIMQLILPFVIVFIFYCVLIVYSFYVEVGVNVIPDVTPTQVVPS